MNHYCQLEMISRARLVLRSTHSAARRAPASPSAGAGRSAALIPSRERCADGPSETTFRRAKRGVAKRRRGAEERRRGEGERGGERRRCELCERANEARAKECGAARCEVAEAEAEARGSRGHQRAVARDRSVRQPLVPSGK